MILILILDQFFGELQQPCTAQKLDMDNISNFDITAGGTTTSRRRAPEKPLEPVQGRGSTVERSVEKVVLTLPAKKGVQVF